MLRKHLPKCHISPRILVCEDTPTESYITKYTSVRRHHNKKKKKTDLDGSVGLLELGCLLFRRERFRIGRETLVHEEKEEKLEYTKKEEEEL